MRPTATVVAVPAARQTSERVSRRYMGNVMTDAANNAPSKSSGSSWKGTALRALIVLVVGAIVAAGLIVFMAGSGALTDHVAKLATDALGRPVTIGSAKISLGSPATVTVSEVAIANADGKPGKAVTVKGGTARVDLNWSPLLNFNPVVQSIELVEPKAEIVTSADGKTNLDFGGAGGGTSALALPRTITVKQGKLSYAKEGADAIEISAIDGVLGIDPATGKTSAKGRGELNGEAVDFDLALDDLAKSRAGLPTGIKASVKAPKGGVDLAGEVVLSGEPQFNGDVQASTGSLSDLAHWIDPKSTLKPGTLAAALAGKVRARTGELTMDGTDVKLGGNNAKVTGTLAVAGPRPKLSGSVEMARLDLADPTAAPPVQPEAVAARAAPAEEETVTAELVVEPDPQVFIEHLNAIKAGIAPSPRAAAEPTVEALEAAAVEESVRAAAAKAAWSQVPLDLSSLGSADLDVALTTESLMVAGFELKNARIKTHLEGAELVTVIEDADIAGGKAKGTIKIDGSSPKAAADITLELTQVAAEPVITQLTGKPFLSGTTDATIEIKAAGGDLNALAATMEGKARFKMSKGYFRGIDVKKEANNFCLSELLSGVLNGTKKSFQVDLKQKTGFEKLDADYTIRNGVAKSAQGLAVGGDEVEIKSLGEVSVARKLVNQNVRLKVVPPPKVPSIPVVITGSWDKLSFKLDNGAVDWIAVVNAALFGCAPRVSAVAESVPGEPLPVGVAEAIEGVLAANPPGLNDEGKDALRALLPAKSGLGAAPDGAAQPSDAVSEPSAPAQ